jgi:CofD-related protein of GAK system
LTGRGVVETVAMKRVPVEREALLPDPVRVARYRAAPELGPRILFFSGGSALRKIARQLKRYTHNSVHLVTPFDSGGSSAQLRRAFGMLSVGDLRNRLLSLADETVRANPEIFELFSHRLPSDQSNDQLLDVLKQMVVGTHLLVDRVPEPLRRICRTHLRDFLTEIPAEFDLRRASVGNLILTGGYLANDRDIDAVIFLISQLVEVRGLVRPSADCDAHIRAELESGEVVVGQHRLTARGDERIGSPVAKLTLVDALEDPAPISVEASEEVIQLIRDAELICFPFGSFYSSVIANLLPRGIGRAIAAARCPKVFVPNMGVDEEQIGMSLQGSVQRIVDAVRADAGPDVPVEDVMDLVLVDTQGGRYDLALHTDRVLDMGVHVVDLPLVRAERWPLVDAETLVQVLLSLV